MTVSPLLCKGEACLALTGVQNIFAHYKFSQIQIESEFTQLKSMHQNRGFGSSAA